MTHRLTAAALLALSAGHAAAQSTILVPEDFSTVNLAIAAASNGDTIAATPSAISLTGFSDFLGKSLNLQSRGFFPVNANSLWLLPDGTGWLGESNDDIQIDGAVRIQPNANVFFFFDSLFLSPMADLRLSEGATLDFFGSQQIDLAGDVLIGQNASLNIASTADPMDTSALDINGLFELRSGAILSHDAGCQIPTGGLLLGQNAQVTTGELELSGGTVSMDGSSLTVNSDLRLSGGGSETGTVSMSQSSLLVNGDLRFEGGESIISLSDSDFTIIGDIESFGGPTSIIAMTGGSLTINGETLNAGSIEFALQGTDVTFNGDQSGFSGAATDANITVPSIGAGDLSGSVITCGSVFTEFQNQLRLDTSVLSAVDVMIAGGVIRGSGSWSIREGFDIQQGSLVIEGDTTMTFGQFGQGLDNDGLIAILSGTLTIIGELQNNGTIVGDLENPGAMTRLGGPARGLVLLPTNSGQELRIEDGQGIDFSNGQITVYGGFNIDTLDNLNINLRSTDVRLVPADIAELRTPATDYGPILQGLDRNTADAYPVGVLRIAAGDSEVRSAGEANYVDHLVIEPGAVLATDGGNLYYRTIDNEGTILDPANVIQINACSTADLAEPFGIVNFNDVIAYLSAFADGSPLAQTVAPFDVLNFNDIIGFLNQFSAGCP